MATQQFIPLAILSLLLSSFPTFATDPTAKEIEALIQKLGSQSFRERESAQKALSELSEDCLPRLNEVASKVSDAEVRGRLQSVIKLQMDKMFGLIHTFHTESSVITASLSPDGKILSSIGFNGVALFWDAATGKLIREMTLSKNGLDKARFSPDCTKIAFLYVSSLECYISIISAESGKKLQEMEGLEEGVNDLSWSKDGKLLVAAGSDKYVRLWDVSTGKELNRFHCANFAQAAAISPEGKRIVGCSAIGKLYVWTADGGKILGEWETNGPGVRRVKFSPDGKTIAANCGDKLIRLFDAESGKEIRRFAGHADAMNSLHFSPDGSRLLSGGLDDAMFLWDVATGKPLHVYRGHSKTVMHVEFSADGRKAISASVDGDVHLWRVPK